MKKTILYLLLLTTIACKSQIIDIKDYANRSKPLNGKYIKDIDGDLRGRLTLRKTIINGVEAIKMNVEASERAGIEDGAPQPPDAPKIPVGDYVLLKQP